MVAEDGLDAKRSVSPNEETPDAESDFPKSLSNNWLGRGRVGRRSPRPEDCGLLILAAEPKPSKSRFSFELGKVSITTLLTYILHSAYWGGVIFIFFWWSGDVNWSAIRASVTRDCQ